MKSLNTSRSWLLICVLPFALAAGCDGGKGEIRNVQKLKPVPVNDITIEDPFWSPRLAVIEDEAIPCHYERLEELGRIENFRRAAAGSGMHQGPRLGDAHVYKWIEAAACVLERRPDAPVAGKVREVTGLVAAAQRPDGYLNTFIQLKHPGKQWINLGMGCELYCAGHFIQAALAHHRALKDRTLLDGALKFADLICRTFGESDRRGAPGYPGIESALTELYRFTKDRKYLDTAEFFLLERGKKPFLFEGEPQLEGVPEQSHGPTYFQAHKPFDQQTDVTGHGGRAMRLYAGAADVYGETGRKSLGLALDKLWQSALDGQAQITGGLGSACGIPGSFEGDYTAIDAQAAALLWSWRMLQIKGEFPYAAVVEQTLHNAILGCLSLDGKRFFPRMPLESKGDMNRIDTFDDAPCPSEALRILASFPRYLYSTSKEGIWLHMYVSGTVRTEFADLEIDSQYPWTGIIRIIVRPKTDKPFSIFVRKLNFSNEALTRVKGVEEEIFPRHGGGYAQLHHEWKDGDGVDLMLDIPLAAQKSTTLLGKRENRVAMQKGPLLYCMEEIDNPGAEGDLDRLVMNRQPRIKEDFYIDLLGGVKKMKVWGTCRKNGGGWDHAYLYLVPYIAWNNRGEGAMRFWIKQQ